LDSDATVTSDGDVRRRADRNLDPTMSAKILELLRDPVTSYGQTTVMVTHDAHAGETADRVLFRADGVIVNDLGRSTTHEILEALEELTVR
jgi:putative ABC transport system ATP-binding protein